MSLKYEPAPEPLLTCFTNAGGGGEYLTNEGLFGFRLSNADNSEQVQSPCHKPLDP